MNSVWFEAKSFAVKWFSYSAFNQLYLGDFVWLCVVCVSDWASECVCVFVCLWEDFFLLLPCYQGIKFRIFGPMLLITLYMNVKQFALISAQSKWIFFIFFHCIIYHFDRPIFFNITIIIILTRNNFSILLPMHSAMSTPRVYNRRIRTINKLFQFFFSSNK